MMLLFLVAQLPIELLGDVDCSKNPVVQVEATHCAWRDYQAADAALNAQWKRTLAFAHEKDARFEELPNVSRDKRPSYSTVLLKSQRAWLHSVTPNALAKDIMGVVEQSSQCWSTCVWRGSLGSERLSFVICGGDRI
jgi:uncharacterized protein YecT (DUF1311 family)